METKTIILAIGNKKVDGFITNTIAPKCNAKVIDTVYFKSDLVESLKRNVADVIFISKSLGGTNIGINKLIIDIKKNYPRIKIIYLAGNVEKSNKEKRKELGYLALAGIYDIVTGSKLTPSILLFALTNNKTEDDVREYIDCLEEKNNLYNDDIVNVECLDETEEEEEEENKISVIGSLKPGSGKTFMSVNTALAIALYGKKSDGTKLRVCLIEADLQNLSVGTVLGIDEKEYNLKTVMDKIGKIINDRGELIDNPVLIAETDKFIKKSFLKYSHCKNLECLVGSSLYIDDVEDIKPEYYSYLIETIEDDYDVIIIDSNSSLHHTTTAPILSMCKRVYYIMSLDYNNAKNNVKYKNTLDELGVLEKTKYILNQDIDIENMKLMGQNIPETNLFSSQMLEEAGFEFLVKIPVIPQIIFNNRVFLNKPLILDDEEETLKARLEILKLANDIYKIDYLQEVEQEYEDLKARVLGSKKKKGFFK